VIGTSLDAQMQDDVRVTVVATGLNRMPARGALRAAGMGGQAAVSAGLEMRQRPRPVILRTGTGNEVVDYAQPEQVAQATAGGTREVAAKPADPGFDYLDIPAFLRRQAD
jgi:cell division protein FtsZ